jgi:zinc-binding alcohol dehydrogenase family protein
LYKYLPIDDPESFVDVDVPTPVPSGRDLLVRVKAVSVNPVDTKLRAPKDTVETQPRILGWDAAGVVEAMGDEASLFDIGDDVYYAGDITRPGCNSALHLVDERIAARKPQTITFEEAAALPLTTITAWEALFDRLAVGRAPRADNASVLIIGGAGGVGSIAIQLAKCVAGLHVIATASREASAVWCRQMGADQIINHHQPFRAEFDRLQADDADYILCFNSVEQHLQGMADVIKPQGKLCTIVRAKNNAPMNMTVFFSKSVAYLSEMMFTRPMFKTPDMQAQHDLLRTTAGLVDEGIIQTTMTEHGGPLTAENLRKAHARIETGRMIGKLVLGEIT